MTGRRQDGSGGPETVAPFSAFGPVGERYGEDQYGARRALEDAAIEERGRGQGRGIFRFERKLNLYRMIEYGLKASLLWGRAVRNFLDFRIVEQEWASERLPAAFDGFRILQLSDLHSDLHPAFSPALADAVRGLDYDVVVLTGDYRADTGGDPEPAEEATCIVIDALRPPCYSVLGNHDSITMVPALEDAGARFLLNENVAVERDGERIHIAGIDDPNFYRGHDLDKARFGIPDGAFTILLSHAPQTYREAAGLGYDLMLAGHTHGGQLCLPGGHVLVHDHTAPRRFLKGRWRYNGLQGYTANGTGCTGVPARLNCPAEITLHTLRRSPAR